MFCGMISLRHTLCLFIGLVIIQASDQTLSDVWNALFFAAAAELIWLGLGKIDENNLEKRERKIMAGRLAEARSKAPEPRSV